MYEQYGAMDIASTKGVGSIRRMSRREILLAKKEEFERYLENINAAIEALDQYPNVEKVLDLLDKV